MRLYELGVGKIVKGVNTTMDVGVGELTKQAKKFGNSVDGSGNPPVNPGGKLQKPILNELFDTTSNWKWASKSQDYLLAEFKAKGINYTVSINKTLNYYDITFGIGDNFGSDKFKIANTDNALEVFSNLVSIIDDFIKTYKPEQFRFEADNIEPSRVKLYKRGSEQLADKYNYKLEIKQGIPGIDADGEHTMSTGFVFKRKEPINEAVDYSWRFDTTAVFKVGTMTYNVDFLPISNEEHEYNVEFSAARGTKFGNNKEMGQSSIQVFGTVIQIMKEFIKNDSPDKLIFVGEKNDNRADLYIKLINKFKPELESLNYSVEVKDSNEQVSFIISKKEKQINELFDTDLAAKLIPGEGLNATGKFSVKGQGYTVDFEQDYGMGDEGLDDVEITFYADGFSERGKDFYALTGGGNQFQVMATVSKLIIQYMKKFKPGMAVFSANILEPSRVKLYDKGAKLISNQLPDYDMDIQNSTDSNYVFIKKQLNESPIKIGNLSAEHNSPVHQMIEKFNNLTDQNPLNSKQQVLGLAKAELYSLGNTTIRLSDIQGLGDGSGTRLMKLICNLADEFDVRIKLLAYGYDSIPTEKLIKWYKGFGFRPVSEFEEDDEGVEMMRNPK